MVNIHIGNHPEPFSVHKNIIAYYSPFFNQALKNVTMAAGSTQTIMFEEGDIDISIFGYFVRWIYDTRPRPYFYLDGGWSLKLIEYAKLYLLFDRFMVGRATYDDLLTFMKTLNYDGDNEDEFFGTLKDLQEVAYDKDNSEL